MKIYAIEELTALPDADLNALAAELRGAKLTGLLGKEEIDVWEFPEKPAHHNYKLQIRAADWQPTTNRNQSGELLQWAVDRFTLTFATTIDFAPSHVTRGIYVFSACGIDIEISGNTARAETEAFCAAMHAIQNAQGGASE